jgi:hypothetical protein
MLSFLVSLVLLAWRICLYDGRCDIDIRTEAVIHAYISLVLPTNTSPI